MLQQCVSMVLRHRMFSAHSQRKFSSPPTCMCGLLVCLHDHCPAMNATDANFNASGVGESALSLAPYQGSSIESIDIMLSMSSPSPGFNLLDLGCGDGRLLIRAITHWGAATAEGWEFSKPIKALADAHVQAALPNDAAKQKCRVVLGDAAKADWRGKDVVTLFLLPRGLMVLRPRIEQELVRRNKDFPLAVVSNGWPIPGLVPKEERVSSGGSRIFLYTT